MMPIARLLRLGLLATLLATGTAACTPALAPTATPTVQVEVIVPTPPPTATPPTVVPTPTVWRDASDTLAGLCFPLVQALANEGAVFVLRNAADHIAFYDDMEARQLCADPPLERLPFDFSSGALMVGRFSVGVGCTAQHQVVDYQRDDAAKTLVIVLRLVVSGACPYDLVVPFWVVFEGVTDYAVDLRVVS
jgi:hypothetical protein